MKTKIILAISVIALAFSSCKKKETKTLEPTPTTPNYTNFKITSVKITAMPFVNTSGSSWDISDGADVFFNMEDVNSNIIFNGSGSSISDVVSGDLPLSWVFSSAYQITNTSVSHYVTVYDYDSLDPNDLIGYVGFKMDDHKSGYPTTISKTNGSLSVTIIGSWY